MNVPQEQNQTRPFLGCIADDVTGATDLAINLTQGGMRVVQVFGVPTESQLASLTADALVVALKTRSIKVEDAVSQSLAALETLRAAGCQRFFFKYCSTFDSTPEGNIGPVADALMQTLGAKHTIFCPAFPRAGRTVYHGHLFVNGVPLNESGMEKHPLNPMTDANLLRWLQHQCGGKTGLVSYDAFAAGIDSCQPALAAQLQQGATHVVTDACDDEHLRILAQCVSDLQLVTGGSGIARYLAEAYRNCNLLTTPKQTPEYPQLQGRALVLAGSCSQATRAQVAWARKRYPARALDVPALFSNRQQEMANVLKWAREQASDQPIVLYSTAPPDDVARWQAEFGRDEIAHVIEGFMAEVAVLLVDEIDVRRLILAGGETAGAVVDRLAIDAIQIGPEICPGVPWTQTSGDRPLALALKSGNFGSIDFFQRALDLLP